MRDGHAQATPCMIPPPHDRVRSPSHSRPKHALCSLVRLSGNSLSVFDVIITYDIHVGNETSNTAKARSLTNKLDWQPSSVVLL